MSTALEGIRVFDCTQHLMGPLATAILGDLGAEIIKVEHPVRGDPSRGFIQLNAASTGVGGRNAYFEHCNRNKKSITLDLSKPRGKEIAYEFVKKSDVFMHSMRKGDPEKLGMDYATLSKLNPQLIYASASAWGPKGPDIHRPSFDMAAQARSGFMTVSGEPGTPPAIVQGIADQTSGIIAALAVVSAIAARERLGVGQEVETSLLGNMVFWLGLHVDFELLLGAGMPRFLRSEAGNPLWNYYRCKDDKWIVLAHIQPDPYWPTLCRTLGIAHLERDPRFETMIARGRNCVELVSILDGIFASRTRAEWLEMLGSDGELIYEPVNTIPDVVKDEQVRTNGYIIEQEHPVWGRSETIGFPVHFSRTPFSVRLPAPEFGAHTEEVFQEVLGYSWDDIAKLKDEKVI